MTKELALSSSKAALGLIAGAVIALTTISTTAGAAKPEPGNAGKPGAQNIVEIVLENDGEFDVLQAAVVRAGLVDALSGTKQYTVFAPTDAAFKSLFGVVDEYEAIAEVNKIPVDDLTDILLYHVTEGRRGATSVLAAPRYQMLNGDKLTRQDLTSAGIADVNISASNGVIHVINSVL